MTNKYFKNILMYSTQLGVHHDVWKDDENINNILDVNTNSLSMMIKHNNPNLDDVSIKCITLALYLNIYIDCMT